MSNLVVKLQHIESLHNIIESKGELSDEVLRKIDYKFRLECNYNSNKIEGGTLTKPETRSVMIGNITVEGKPLKDIREMKGHDEAMKDILSIGKEEKRISEKRIRDIHKQIIVPESTEEGKEIGEWKRIGNHIINYRLEKFQFTPPNEVPQAIHDLLNWLNAGLDKIQSKQKDAPHPLLLAFEFHTKYLTIHPFTDGNGRTARILTNLILVSLGYPPFWVTEGGEKDAYNRYLADVQAYGGSPDLLYEFLAGLVERSLQLTLDAVEGREIEDMDDWSKKLRLLKSDLPKEESNVVSKTKETTKTVFENSILPTIKILSEKLSEFNDLFSSTSLGFGMDTNIRHFGDVKNILQHWRGNNTSVSSITFIYILVGFKKSESPFDIKVGLTWNLLSYEYSLSISDKKTSPLFTLKYHQFYAEQDLQKIVKKCADSLLQKIEDEIKRT